MTTKVTTLLALVALAGSFLGPHSARAVPDPTFPAVAIGNDPNSVPVAITGNGFGSPDPNSSLVVDGLANPIPSQQSCDTSGVPCILFWENTGIAAKLPTSVTKPKLTVVVGAAQSQVFRAQTWAYDYFDINTGAAATPETNPAPLALEIDPTHRVWINEEFHKAIKTITPQSGQSPVVAKTTMNYPAYPNYPFEFGGNPTQNDVLGEDVVIDPYGRAWVSEGGGYLYLGTAPNHSRVVMYAAPSNPVVYNLPGNDDEAFGLAYEANYDGQNHDRVWYTAIALYSGNGFFPFRFVPARVGWFRVANGYPDGNTGFTAFSPTGTCGPNKICHAFNPYGTTCTADADCAPRCVSGTCRFGKLNGSCTTDADCAVSCVANRCNGGNFGNCLGAADCTPKCEVTACSDGPTRGCRSSEDCTYTNVLCGGTDTTPGCIFHEYPLPPATFIPANLALAGDGAVWIVDSWGLDGLLRLDKSTGRVRVFPVGDDPNRGANWAPGASPFEVHIASNGDILTNEYMDFTVDRLDISRVNGNDPLCESFTGTQNPCLTVIPVPGPTHDDPSTACPPAIPCGGAGQPACSQPWYNQHTIAPDPRQNVWFTTNGSVSDPKSRATVGFVKRDWKAAVLFPPLSIYPFYDDGTTNFCHTDPYCPSTFRAFHGAGIRVDSGTEEVWFSDYCRKRVGRMHPQTVNLALGKTTSATQSSLGCEGSVCGSAGAAVDGNIDGVFADGSVAETSDTNQPWWQVDLGNSYPIDEIELWNRTDCCDTRLHNFDIFVSDLPFTSNNPSTISGTSGVKTISNSGTAPRRYAASVGRTGRYVRVQLLGTTDQLQLAEVVVYGSRCTTATSCDDANTCTGDTCDSASGACSHSCNTGGPCTVGGCGGTCKNDTGPCMCVLN